VSWWIWPLRPRIWWRRNSRSGPWSNQCSFFLCSFLSQGSLCFWYLYCVSLFSSSFSLRIWVTSQFYYLTEFLTKLTWNWGQDRRRQSLEKLEMKVTTICKTTSKTRMIISLMKTETLVCIKLLGMKRLLYLSLMQFKILICFFSLTTKETLLLILQLNQEMSKRQKYWWIESTNPKELIAFWNTLWNLVGSIWNLRKVSSLQLSEI